MIFQAYFLLLGFPTGGTQTEVVYFLLLHAVIAKRQRVLHTAKIVFTNY